MWCSWVDSYFYIECESETQLKEVLLFTGERGEKAFADLPELYGEDYSNPGEYIVRISFTDSKLYIDWEDAIVSFAEELYSRFGLEVKGHAIEEADCGRYRCELDRTDDGEIYLCSENTDWLLEFSCDTISKLKGIAKKLESNE